MSKKRKFNLRRKLQTIIVPLVYKFKRGKMMKFFANFCSEGDLVFDIGAFEGYMTDVFLSLGARVIALEPNPDIFKTLEKKFKDNANVTLLNKGVGDKPVELTFYVCEGDPMLSTFSKKHQEGRYSSRCWDKEVKIPVVTIDSLIKEHGTPKFIKIDVEGFELEVIKGLSRKVKFLTYEFHDEFLEEAKQAATYLSKLGKTRFNYNIDMNFEPTTEKWYKIDNFLEVLSDLKEKGLNGDIIVEIE